MSQPAGCSKSRFHEEGPNGSRHFKGKMQKTGTAPSVKEQLRMARWPS
ncbi:hypothetical protein HMPREF9436_02812 [Faecalibacterium cf. prausnitzii KLE1255]|uniref:Uncharacterized protein n=1 Tax=Faecalibacterium cf. prausnitzii KLE1255 TaxID=748224 RepID=E2ZM95_9FIRM|nr:hypothetical protein HMPREF9436_02812 [Faecalibacterium cf. prausnitzii KLE1255]